MGPHEPTAKRSEKTVGRSAASAPESQSIRGLGASMLEFATLTSVQRQNFSVSF